jgi:glycerol-3-phosphate acyltransferase PlsY
MPWLLIPLTYFLGSVSFAYLAGRAKGIDLRQHGSGNLGATNAGRVLGGRWFAVVFIADVLKGLLPVSAAHVLSCPPEHRPWLLLATATAAILGHVLTCFHGFKGGKAVATSLGVIAALVWPVALVGLGVWLLVWFLGWQLGKLGKAGAVGLASVIAALAVPPARLWLSSEPWSSTQLPITIFLILLAFLVVIKHRANLQKLFQPRSSPEKTSAS